MFDFHIPMNTYYNIPEDCIKNIDINGKLVYNTRKS